LLRGSSFALYLEKKTLGNYWFESGSPSFLIELLSKDPLVLNDIEDKAIDAGSLKSWEIGTTPTIIILYQAGYLTIKNYSIFKTIVYTLGYPNEEVRLSMGLILFGLLTKTEKSAVIDGFHGLKTALLKVDIQSFCKIFQSLLAGITYHHHKRDEAFYHALFEFLILGLGFGGESEVSTSNGRIDFVLKVDKKIYLFEIKLNFSPEKALEQIEDRRYYEKYQTTGKEIIMVGLSFQYKKKALVIDCIQKIL
jgi:PD-(D/E)XK nuclease superfamily